MDNNNGPAVFKPTNGDLNNGKLITPAKLPTKKKLPPIDDTRNDLLKAIRDGTFDKIERKLFENKFKNKYPFVFSFLYRYQTSKSGKDRTEKEREYNIVGCCIDIGTSCRY